MPADNIIFTITSERTTPNSLPEMNLKVLMIRRKKWPYAGCWALPGGFSNEDETLLDAAKRELKEETGISGLQITHLDVYSTPKRDPRGWIISSAYCALVNEKYLEHRKAADDAADEQLFNVNELLSMIRGDENADFDSNEGKLAFDHHDIINDAFKMIQKQILESNIAKEFLPEEFTISELFKVISTVYPELKEIYPKEQLVNFRRKVLTRKLIESVDKESNRNSRRAAQLYKFSDQIPVLSHYI
ncbi:Bifunctional NMN adenylyltransferase/Nudix hydrolase [compost metagenome]